MDNMPTRGTSIPAERRVPTEQPVPVSAPNPTPNPVLSAPIAHTPTPTRQPKVKKHRRKPILGIIILVVIIVIAGIGYKMVNQTSVASTITKSEYQAIFLTTGQVYFGKLTYVNGDYFKLTDIFYLQSKTTDSTTSNDPQAATSSSDSDVLTKLGNEIHGPEDEMIISKAQVLFFENLKPTGKVSQLMTTYTKNLKN
jgi:hypothetical protein